MRRRRRPEDGKINQERWLITYSDLITLLMIFFVIMYAMSKVDMYKFVNLSASLSQALYNQNQVQLKGLGTTGLIAAQPSAGPPGRVPPAPDFLKTPEQVAEERQLAQIKLQLQSFIQKQGVAGQVVVEDKPKGLLISLRDVILFDTGKADLKPEARKLLDGLLPFLAQVGNPLEIEGHTDNRPIHTAQFPSNWELSTARALTVLEYLQAKGIDPKRLSATGYGEWRPVASNDNPEGQALNRRVNITIERTSAINGPADQAPSLSGP
ncbi:OmpA family protein [Kyrpidia tusciae]|uniref:OmpA/MotB domain protein n=1 Tax=Kyrpidia tusciae (strain DSM 2912 / NBRC 15312 / T2) TaxID=562970 RepID=D5WRC9_KYRT2|nr:OmpA family protein [Kyrpidia tusciae]ADG06859.1 OmpA/MotB domain protein [Kyrpidia tusciae DSM 2912]